MRFPAIAAPNLGSGPPSPVGGTARCGDPTYARAMLDIAIALALLAGVVAGWRKGFIVPVVAQLGVLLGLAFVYAGPLSGSVPSGSACCTASRRSGASTTYWGSRSARSPHR